jgi:uncharacterized protein (TIGR02246 family)
MRAVALASAAIFLMAAPSLAQQVPAEITAANRRFEQALNRGDAAAVAAMYTEDATLLPPGAEMVTGRQAVQSFWHGAYGSGLRNLSLDTVSFEAYGDAGREIGRFTADAPGQGGRTTRVEGKYVVVWKRTAEGWRLDADIWNTNR